MFPHPCMFCWRWDQRAILSLGEGVEAEGAAPDEQGRGGKGEVIKGSIYKFGVCSRQPGFQF